MTDNVPAKLEFNERQVQLMKDTLAKNCSDLEFELFMTLAKAYSLDPFKGQIWVVKYGTAAARVFTGRDGFLEIAHRSGQFDGMVSGSTVDVNGEITGFAKVYRKDMSHPFEVEVALEEYQRKYGDSVPLEFRIWETKPRTMIQKVAESQALRKAFSAFGLYSPEEFGEAEEKPAMKNVTPPAEVMAALKAGAPVIDADTEPAKKAPGAEFQQVKKRQVKVGGKWVDEDKADLIK